MQLLTGSTRYTLLSDVYISKKSVTKILSLYPWQWISWTWCFLQDMLIAATHMSLTTLQSWWWIYNSFKISHWYWST